MDQRDAMALSGFASFSMQRGGAGSGTQSGSNLSSPSFNPLHNSSLTFQSNIGVNTIGSTLPMQPSTTVSSFHGVNMGTSSTVPQSGEPMKRKKGRPRKYGPDRTLLALSPILSTHYGTITPTQKRPRGRPKRSGKNQQLASEVSFQSNTGVNTIGSTLPMEPSTTMSSSHGVNMCTSSTVPQSGEPMERKRGRPRKYGPDGTPLVLSPALSAHPGTITPTEKGCGGRPKRSGKKQQLASKGIGFTPHIITVAAGEDIAAKILSFSQQVPRAVCVLSANGSVSNVTLRQPSATGGTVTHQGPFEIICLSGSYLIIGYCSRTGGLSVLLASPDGRVIGGRVAGLLPAASPVRVIVGRFLRSNSRKEENKVEGVDSGIEAENLAGTSIQQTPNLTPTP